MKGLRPFYPPPHRLVKLGRGPRARFYPAWVGAADVERTRFSDAAANRKCA